MRVAFVLEHGPWVVRSHKLTRERSIFLSITRIVCGNINTDHPGLGGVQQTPRPLTIYSFKFSAFSKEFLRGAKEFLRCTVGCTFPAGLTFAGVKPFSQAHREATAAKVGAGIEHNRLPSFSAVPKRPGTFQVQ